MKIINKAEVIKNNEGFAVWIFVMFDEYVMKVENNPWADIISNQPISRFFVSLDFDRVNEEGEGEIVGRNHICITGSIQ